MTERVLILKAAQLLFDTAKQTDDGEDVNPIDRLTTVELFERWFDVIRVAVIFQERLRARGVAVDREEGAA